MPVDFDLFLMRVGLIVTGVLSFLLVALASLDLDLLGFGSKAIGGALARPFARALIELQLAFLFYCAGDRGAAARAFRAAVDIDASMFHSVRFLAGWLIRRRYEMGSFTPAPPDGFLTWFAEQAVPRGASLRSWRPLLAAFLATQNVAARRCGRRVRSLLARIP